MDIKDSTIAVSGAMSGLGKATTDLLVLFGANVIALDIKVDQDTLESWISQSVKFYQCDVRSSEQVNKCINSGVAYWGGLQGAVACAGIAPAQKIHSSRSGSHSAHDFSNTLEINLGGTFHLFNSCVPHIKSKSVDSPDAERGVLIATSSIAAYEGQTGQVAYAASKGGVSAMILPLARELAKAGIRVNAIAPGIFQTPMMSSFSDELQQSLAAQVPFPKRLGHPNEFARLVEHIITNSYINGTVIRLDGGIRMI